MSERLGRLIVPLALAGAIAGGWLVGHVVHQDLSRAHAELVQARTLEQQRCTKR